MIPSLVAAPKPMAWLKLSFAKPVAITTMLLVPALCSKASADGVKVIWLALTEYAVGDKVKPPTVMLVIADRQDELSVKVTVNALSTVTPDAAVNVGGAGAGMLKLLETMCVSEPEVKSIVAPLIEVFAVAVKPAKVATPEDAATESVPERVHPPCPVAAPIEAELEVTVLPY